VSPRQKGRSKATSANPATAPRRASPRERRTPAGADSAPPPSARMPEPATHRPPPTHPFLPFSTCPKSNPGIRGYAKPPCSAGKRRLIVAKPGCNKPLFAAQPGINF
jgi:hypothetical protein